MYLIQILLPLYDNQGNPFPNEEYTRLRDELSERFGGITTYMRSPASGLWRETSTSTVQDEIVIFEVMTDQLERLWWQSYRMELAAIFRQEVLVVRVTEMELL